MRSPLSRCASGPPSQKKTEGESTPKADNFGYPEHSDDPLQDGPADGRIPESFESPNLAPPGRERDPGSTETSVDASMIGRIISNSRGNAVEFSQLVDGDNIQELDESDIRPRVVLEHLPPVFQGNQLRAATMTNAPLEVWETKLLCFGATSKKRYLVAEWLFEGVAEWNGDAGRGRRRKKMSNVDRRIPLRFGGGLFELDILKV
ncbi:hypothetical protein BKA57DRAFT_496350 [Linnemannia elongata]|nr:hypothetical protein BKA57DRAFT_496350 [Linnemannia elongata]